MPFRAIPPVLGLAVTLSLILASCASPGAARSTAGTSASATAPVTTPATTAPSPAPSPTEAGAVTSLTDDVAAAADFLPDAAPDYESYVPIKDDDTGFSFDAPAAWSTVDISRGAGDTQLDVTSGATLDFDHPSVSAHLRTTGETPEQLLAGARSDYATSCSTVGAQKGYDDGRLVGVSQIFSGCPSGTTITVVAFSLKDASSRRTAYFDMTLLDRRDTGALARALKTVQLGG